MYKKQLEEVNSQLAKALNDYNDEYAAISRAYYAKRLEVQDTKYKIEQEMLNDVYKALEKKYPEYKFAGHIQKYENYELNTYTQSAIAHVVSITTINGYMFDGKTRTLFKVKYNTDQMLLYGATQYDVETINSPIALDDLQEYVAELSELFDFDIKVAISNIEHYLPKNNTQIYQTQALSRSNPNWKQEWKYLQEDITDKVSEIKNDVVWKFKTIFDKYGL